MTTDVTAPHLRRTAGILWSEDGQPAITFADYPDNDADRIIWLIALVQSHSGHCDISISLEVGEAISNFLDARGYPVVLGWTGDRYNLLGQLIERAGDLWIWRLSQVNNYVSVRACLALGKKWIQWEPVSLKGYPAKIGQIDAALDFGRDRLYEAIESATDVADLDARLAELLPEW